MFLSHPVLMPFPTTPFDRIIALACTVRILRGRFLYVRCACLASTIWPVRLLLERHSAVSGRTLADMIVVLRCARCGARPQSVHLTEAPYPPDVRDDVVPGWNILLHGTEAGMGSIKAPDAMRIPGAANVE